MDGTINFIIIIENMSVNSYEKIFKFEEWGNENSGPEFLSITYAKYLRLLCKNYIPDVDFTFVFVIEFVPL